MTVEPVELFGALITLVWSFSMGLAYLAGYVVAKSKGKK